MPRASLTRFAWLSIAAALMTIGLKFAAYLLSGSVGLLSDAMESGVNLIAAIVALVALTIAARPSDEQHNFGHDKAEYFSSGVEGALILVAAFSIAYTSIERLLNPQPIEQIGLGLAISLSASLINLFVARILLRAGKAHQSITLEADAHHLMTDVWTSAGVVVGVGVVGLTGILWLDPIIALAVAANIVFAGFNLLKRSALGLMDTAADTETLAKITGILDGYRASRGLHWHGLRTRKAGSRTFLTVHILVPADWSVKQGHDLLEVIERDLRDAVPMLVTATHLEPLNDPLSDDDQLLDRPAAHP